MPRTILIVDDVQINRQILHKILASEYNVIEATNGREAMNMLSERHGEISAVLLDVVMPVMDGYAVLQAMSERAELARIPVIVITGSADSATEERALTLGAMDFVVKPFAANIVLRRLENLIKLRETSAMINAYQRDALTGLWNRETFFEKAAALVNQQPAGCYVLGCVDIDNFKVVNDQYGAEKGDAVLIALARVLSDISNKYGGICGRISADNFITLYPRRLADESIADPRALEKAVSEGASLSLSMSVGRYIVEDKSLTLSAMYDRAKLAQNTVKGRYDVRMAVYSESMREKLVREQEIVNEMKSALAEGQFEAWFQPQYNHSTGALIGAEALARWRHPKWGMVSPGEFVPVFEKNGFVYDMDRFIWESVCKSLRRWLDEGRNPLPVSVNISRFDLLRDGLAESILALTEKYSLPPELLRLEVTESAFAQSARQVADVVKKFVEMGFTVEIDDFGSGYSSLNILKDVPAQVLKLDMRFMDTEGDINRGGNILESVVRMSKWIGMSVIAEGVEARSQADYLKTIGCDYIQGYLYARPMPISDYEALALGVNKEERLMKLETVVNLDNSAFWSPESMDTLIFNSFVGAACIFEYNRGKVEMLRATDKFAVMMGAGGLSVQEALKLDWANYLTDNGRSELKSAVEASIKNRDEVTGDYLFTGLPGCPEKVYLRSTIRVIARTGDRCMVYCTNENMTAQRAAERARLAAQARAREASGQLRAIMDDMPGGFAQMRVSPCGEALPVYVNQGFCDMLRITREDFMSGSFTIKDRVHPDDTDIMRDNFIAMLDTGDVSIVRHRLLRGDGAYGWYSSSGRITKSGNDLLLNVYYSDIADAEKRDMDVRAALPFVLSAIMEATNDYAFAKDAEFKYLACSPAFLELCGRKSRSEVIGKTDFDLFPEDMAKQFRVNDEALLSGGHPFVDYYETIHDISGETHYCRASKYILRDSAGSVIGQYGISRDITAERTAFEQLKLLTDSVPGGLASYAVSPDGIKITYYNDGFCKMIGCTREEYAELAKESVISRVFPEDVPALMAQVEDMRLTGAPIDCTYRNHRVNGGGYVWINIRGELASRAGDTAHVNAVLYDVTEQREATERFAAMMDNVNAGVCASLYSEDGTTMERIMFANDEFYAMYGYTKEDFDSEQTSVYGIIHPDDLENLKALIAEQIIKRDKRTCHYRCFARDGGTVYVRCDNAVISMAGVGDNVLLSVITDVSDYVRADTARLSAEAQLRAIMEGINGGVCAAVMEEGRLRYVFVNDQYFAILGYTREQFEKELPGGLLDAVPDSDKARAMGISMIGEEVMDSGTREFRARRRDGAVIWLRSKSSVSRISGIDKPMHIEIIFDVTLEKAAERRLKASEAEYRLAIEGGDSYIYRYDHLSNSVDLSEHVSPLFGLNRHLDDAPDSLIKNSLVAEESVETYRNFLAAIKRGDARGEMTIRRMTAGGEWKWYSGKFNNVFDESGNPVSAVVVFRDVTEQREKEAVYIRWQQSMAERPVQDYTLIRWNLNRDCVIGAVEGELLDYDFARTIDFNARTRDFAGGHVFADDIERYMEFVDCDTMLASYYRGVRNRSIVFREKRPEGGTRWLKLTVELVEYPDSADVCAYMMYENVDEEKRAEMRTRELAELDPLTGVLNRATFADRANRIIAEGEKGAQCALLIVDLDGFKQINDVFGHAAGDQTLIDTAAALKSEMRPDDLVGRLGGDEFFVFLRNMAGESDVINAVSRFTDLLSRAHGPDVRTTASIGIAMCPKDGRTFEEIYPKADAALYAVKESGKNNYAFYRPGIENEAEPAPVQPRARGKRRMMIVDDNRFNAQVLEGIFEDEFLTDIVTDGRSALIRLRHFGAAVSVVLLDLIMPGMDGFEVLDKIRATESTRDIPVIAVSGSDDNATAMMAIRSGATDFVAKPVDADLIRLRVQSAISRAENQRLRAQNNILAMRNGEAERYRAALESVGMTTVEYDWKKSVFTYDPSLTRFIAGTFNSRSFWHILLSDFVADATTVQLMQRQSHEIAGDREKKSVTLNVMLKVPTGAKHRFRMNIIKQVNEFGLTDKLIFTFTDLDLAPGGGEEGENNGQ